LTNETRCAPGLETLQVRYQPVGAGDVVTLSGSVPPGSPEVVRAISVADPDGYAATLFSEALGQGALPLRGRGLPMAGEVVAAKAGRPLRDVVRRLNKESVNLIAEVLLKQVGAVQGGLPGSAAKGLGAAQAMLAQAGWRPETYRLVDGSGLSRYNLVSPRHFVQLLAWMDRGPEAAAYRGSLPVAGSDGTLATRFRGMAGADRILAKTGTMTGVTALSGYTEAADGERLAFSCLLNGSAGPIWPLRQVQDDLVRILREWQR
jgi:PBP4 family serine-type D-alanyl-D-alanine carboxypeptidase